MATPLGTLTIDLIAKTAGFTQPMKNAGDTAERESKRIEKSTGSALEMLKGLGATALAGFTVGTVIAMADEYSQMAAQIRNATSSQQEYDQVQKHLLETANTTYRSLKEAQQVYLDVGGALKAYGETTERSLRITDSLSFSFTHNATQADKAASATDAYMKSIYSGTVSGDAWASILSAIPSIVSDLSKSLNKSEADILSMGNAGKLSSKDLNNALDASREKSEALANSMSNSLQDGLSNARNGFVVLAGEINETFGVTNAMAGSLGIVGETAKLAAENLEVLGNVTAVAGAYLVGSYLPALALGAKTIASDTIAKVSNVLATRAKTLADYEVAKSNLAATAAMVKSMGATNAQTAVMMTNARAAYQQAAAAKASMLSLSGALLGPVGLGIAIATVATGYLLMRDNTEKATETLRVNNESVDDAIKKYNELAVSKRNAQLVSEKEELKKLGDAYNDSNDKLVIVAYALSRHNEMTKEQSLLINALIAEYKKTGDIDAFSQKINSLNFISQTSKDRISTLGGSVKAAGDEFRTQKSFVEQMAPAVKSVGDQAVKTATDVVGLSNEIKELLSANEASTLKNSFLNSRARKGEDPKLAEYLYEARKAEGILGTSKLLSDEALKSVMARYNSEIELNKTLDARNKLEEKNKKLIEAQGNSMKVNALVASNAVKFNFKGIEAKNGLPSGLLSAVHMQESRGNARAYNESSGATGGFQFLAATAKQYGVIDRYNLAQSAEGAGKYLAHLLELFNGDIEKAISAYHAGEGNVQRGTNIGPINRQYVKNVKGYMGGASGASFTEDYSFDDWVKEQEKIIIERERIAEKQKQLNIEVADDAVRIKQQLADKFEEIDKAGFSDAKATELKDQYQKRADIEIQIAQASQADKLSAYSDYMKSEEQLINESYARRQRDLKLDIQLTADQYAEASMHLENQRVKELQQARWHALEMRQTLEDSIKGLSGGADDIFAKSTMTPQEYSQWALESDRSKAQVSLNNQRVGVERDIMTSDAYSTDDERYDALLKAHQEYRDGLYAIDLQYDQSVKDLAQSQMLQQLEMWQGIFSSGQTTFAQLTQSVKNNAGEQSTAYRIAFAGQQSFSIASSLVAAWTAYTQAFADPSAMTLPQKFAGGTAVMGALMPAIATISSIGIDGMAHNGIDNIPKEGTWLLDGGERVLNPQQNKDLTNYLANKPNHQQSQPIENSLRVIMVKDEDEAKDMLYSADGEKAFLYHMKRTGYAKR